MPPLFDDAQIRAKSAELEGRPPQDILAWALGEYGQRVGISTAFGVEGCALIDMAVKIDPAVLVFTVDTDFLFPETYDLIQRMRTRYDLNLKVLTGQVTKDEQERRHGLALYARDSDLCCALR